jgi:hypothetical protein
MLMLLQKFSYLSLSSLTYDERYQAIRQLDPTGGSIMANRWFVLFGASVVFILTILLLAVRRMNAGKEANSSQRRFNESADKRGLNMDERTLLSKIAQKAGVKRKDSVFTMATAFNRGASNYMREYFADGSDIDDRKKMNARVNIIKEKLGFKRKTYAFGVKGGRSRAMTSRQMTEGKKVSLAPAAKPGSTRIQAMILDINELEFSVEPELPIKCLPGDVWNVQYHFCAATWEFEVLTVGCEMNELVLNHSDNIRFINRRRFHRVSVNKPAMVALFPMMVQGNSGSVEAPQFYPATVTEISGPGLRISTELEVSSGDRVLLVFELENGKIVKDIGEIRGYRASANAGSVGVELLGLNEAGVDELVRATNSMAIGAAANNSDAEYELAGGARK